MPTILTCSLLFFRLFLSRVVPLETGRPVTCYSLLLFSSVVVPRRTRHSVTSETTSFAFPSVLDLAFTFCGVYAVLSLERNRVLLLRNTHHLNVNSAISSHCVAYCHQNGVKEAGSACFVLVHVPDKCTHPLRIYPNLTNLTTRRYS